MHIVYVAYVTSAAHCAAAKGHLDCIKALHDDAADLWIASNKGDCPVHEAAMAKHNGTHTLLLTVIGLYNFMPTYCAFSQLHMQTGLLSWTMPMRLCDARPIISSSLFIIIKSQHKNEREQSET